MTLQNSLSSYCFFDDIVWCMVYRGSCMVWVDRVVCLVAGLVTPSAMAMNQRTIDRPEKDRRCRSDPNRCRCNLQHDDRLHDARSFPVWRVQNSRETGFFAVNTQFATRRPQTQSAMIATRLQIEWFRRVEAVIWGSKGVPK